MTRKPVFVGIHPDYTRRFDLEVQIPKKRPDIKVVYSLDDLAKQTIHWARQ